MNIEEAFGLVIRRLRRERNLSQDRLSTTSSLDRAFISKLESGKQQPTLVTIFELANALGVPASRVLIELELLLNINQVKPTYKGTGAAIINNTGFNFKISQEPVCTGTETILLADDESLLRKMISEFLQECGYKIIEAVDGQDAVEKFKTNVTRIRLVLMDVVMPRRDGLSACREIYDHKQSVPMLLMSAYSPGNLGNMDGFNFIHKPMSPHELAQRIRELLDGES